MLNKNLKRIFQKIEEIYNKKTLFYNKNRHKTMFKKKDFWGMLKFLLCPNFIKIKQKLWPVAVLTDTQTENSEPLTKEKKWNQRGKITEK